MKRLTAFTDTAQQNYLDMMEALRAIDKIKDRHATYVKRVQRCMKKHMQLQENFQKYMADGSLFDEIEVYTRTSRDIHTEILVEYWRLLPYEDTPHQLSWYRGFSSGEDAAAERKNKWPNAYYVSPQCFDTAVKLSYKQSSRYYGYCFPGDEASF